MCTTSSLDARVGFGLDFFGNQLFFREQFEIGSEGRTGQQIKKASGQDTAFQLFDAVANETASVLGAFHSATALLAHFDGSGEKCFLGLTQG
jgi:hypothetical protein